MMDTLAVAYCAGVITGVVIMIILLCANAKEPQ